MANNMNTLPCKQENFDEDSDMYARLERWAAGSESLSESLMFQRLAHFDVDTGFEMKRKATEVADFALEMWHRCVEGWVVHQRFEWKRVDSISPFREFVPGQ